MPESGQRIITGAAAIQEAHEIAMLSDPAIYLMGEGVTDPKAIFGTTDGLLAKFGRDRVVEMPISENGMTGIAIGSAIMGRRPVMIHQRVEFCLLAVEQLFNNAAKMHYVSNGRHRVPLTIRLIVGRGWGQGPGHSQSLEAMFAYIPGLKVVMPASAADCKAYTLASIRDDNPVVILEHRWIHYVSGHVPEGDTGPVTWGPRKVSDGRHVTLVATSYMVLEAMQAADALAEAGCEVELIDLRVLRPLDTSMIEDSVRRTGHLVMVDTGFTEYGIGAEVVSRIAERCLTSLKAPPRRLGLASHPTPSSRTLAEVYYPRSPQIADVVGEVVGLPDDVRRQIHETLEASRDNQPLDIPHPSFKGPF
jgi:pyruvate/2-oxoglutarate/acetoin dehydrogenase E1 component